jgi:hypothetical protein
MLPENLFSDQVKVGEVDKKLWIALEDLHDGWEKSGEVGQEVYGAGNAFGISPRHYHKFGAGSMLYCDYPLESMRKTGQRKIYFRLGGDKGIACRLRIIGNGGKSPRYRLLNEQGADLELKTCGGGHLEVITTGDQLLQLRW